MVGTVRLRMGTFRFDWMVAILANSGDRGPMFSPNFPDGSSGDGVLIWSWSQKTGRNILGRKEKGTKEDLHFSDGLGRVFAD